MSLKKARNKKGLSQSQLASASGVNVRMIQKYEQKAKKIEHARYSTLKSLATTLGVSIDEIIKDD